MKQADQDPGLKYLIQVFTFAGTIHLYIHPTPPTWSPVTNATACILPPAEQNIKQPCSRYFCLRLIENGGSEGIRFDQIIEIQRDLRLVSAADIIEAALIEHLPAAAHIHAASLGSVAGVVARVRTRFCGNDIRS